MAQQRENSGVLFKNHKKKTNKHPDYRGDAQINGGDFWIAAWIKEGKQEKFMSLAFTPKDENYQKEEKTNRQNNVEDDIPF